MRGEKISPVLSLAAQLEAVRRLATYLQIPDGGVAMVLKTRQSRRRILLEFSTALIISLLTQSCSFAEPENTIMSSPSLPPPWTPTTSPVPPTTKPTATNTPQPSQTPSCDLSETLRLIKSSITYEQFSVHFVDINGTASLAVWFVDPSLEPFPSSSQLQTELEDAKFHAAMMAVAVNAASPCTSEIAGVINPIVVDRNYQGWVSAQIQPSDISQYEELDVGDAIKVFDDTYFGYLRTSLSHPYFEGSCAWPEAHQRLQSHFDPERELVAFYFVIDDLGSHVWVQWDGEANPIMTVVNLGNVTLALECFSPTADVIYIVVDSNGVAQDMNVLPPQQP